MRKSAGALVLAATLRLPLGEPASVLTVAQRDEWRSNVDAASTAVSADGRYIAFTSYAQLAPADTNRCRDIYVLDRTDGRVTLESVAPDGRASDVDSGHPRISGDGRFLVYETWAASRERSEVVLRDRREGSARIIGSVLTRDSTSGSSGAPVISGDGRIVAFVSTAHLGQGPDANGRGTDVYVLEVPTSIIQRASVDTDGVQPSSGSSTASSVSGDGRYVAFASTASLDPAGLRLRGPVSSRRPASHVYVRDRHLDVTRLLSVGPARHTADGASWNPAISSDGRYVAFVSAATNLAAGDRNRSADVFVADTRTGMIELVSRSAKGGSGNGPSGSPALSADGRFIAFQSEASDLVCAAECTTTEEDINLLWDVFLFDRQTSVMTRMSADAAGGWMEASGGPALDGAGEVVAFSSRHPIDAADKKNDFDLFVRVGRRPSAGRPLWPLALARSADVRVVGRESGCCASAVRSPEP